MAAGATWRRRLRVFRDAVPRRRGERAATRAAARPTTGGAKRATPSREAAMTSSERQTGTASPNARWREPPRLLRFAGAAVTRCVATITRLAARTLSRVRPDRLSIAVRATSIEAVYLRSARLVWRARADLTPGRDVEPALRGLLRTAPGVRRRARVVAAFAPPWAQTKRLVRPPAPAARAATPVVRDHSAAFFHHRAPIHIANARHGRDGSLWSCAFDRTAIERLSTVLAERGLRLHVVVPDDSAAPCSATLANHRVALAWRPSYRAPPVVRCLRIAVGGTMLVVASLLLAALVAPSLRDRGRVAPTSRCVDVTRARGAFQLHSAASARRRSTCGSHCVT